MIGSHLYNSRKMPACNPIRGRRPVLQNCTIAELEVDPAYQRGIDNRPSAALIAAIARLEGRAAEIGKRPSSMTGLNPDRLRSIALAQAPKPHTVARIEAAIRGEPLPPRRRYTLGGGADHRGPPVPEGDRVARDPCFFCGTRGDLGCAHRSAGEPAR